jgi:hypothetical protein
MKRKIQPSWELNPGCPACSLIIILTGLISCSFYQSEKKKDCDLLSEDTVQPKLYPENGGSKFLQNDGRGVIIVRKHMTLHA